LRTSYSRTFFTGFGLAAAAILAASATPAMADISGFGDGSAYTFNSNGFGPVPSLSGSGVLTVTDLNGGEASSVFYNTAQSVSPFNANFTYQYGGTSTNVPADGVTFTLQNQGLNALGGSGGGLGVDGISPSASIDLNLYPGSANGAGTAFNINGGTAQNGGNLYMSTGAVDLTSGDPIDVALSYDGTTLTEMLTDTSTAATFSTSYTTDLVSLLGPNAFVGFTGGTGAANSIQQISNFSFTNNATAVPEPSSLAALAIGMLSLGGLALRSRKSRTTTSL
jgi:hypothetical protein